MQASSSCSNLSGCCCSFCCDYHASDGQARLVDITKQFAPIVAADCTATFEVVGTTESGAIVLELHSAKQCASSGRWLLDSSGKRPQRALQGAPILDL